MKADRSSWQQFHDQEAASYDGLCYTQNTAQEVEFLIETLQLAAGASILDVGCGTGRHAIALARRGYRVTGLDLSDGMLARAREKAQAAQVEINWIQGDASRFALAREFDAVICVCEGAFGLLGGADDSIEQPLAILRNVSRSLKPGGRTLFTVLSAFKMIREQAPADVEQGRFDPLTMTTSTEHSPVEGALAIRLRLRGFTPTELKLLFQLAGLEVLHVGGGTAGDWGWRGVRLDEFEIMVVAQKPAP